MCDHHDCERLLKIIAEIEDGEGRAPVTAVAERYGPEFEDAWVYARNRFYLESGSLETLCLSRGGRLAFG